ncbi:MAG: efflux RND transporter periplasmic adaptor subunit [Steroidobacteraceae bacterium]|jgi:multidrug efflux system membrane fusion protein
MTDTDHLLSGPTTGTTPKHHWVRPTLIVLGVLIVGWLIFKWLFAPKAKPAVVPVIPVAVGSVQLGDINVYLDELGTVTPVYTVTVASRVAGELTEVRYTEGQLVKKNELLAIIDPRPYRALVVQAQGQLSRDQALLANARLDLVRYQNSFKEHAIPEQQLATQQALVEQDEGTVTLDQGNLDAAQVNLDYTRIVSPIDGRVGLRLVDPGNIVPANGTTGIATITQLQPITVIFTIAEDNLDEVTEQIAAGHKLSVTALDRTRNRTLSSGTLLALDNQINVATGTVRARASFANTHNELFPNQFVNTRLLVKTLTKVNLVPDAAIQRNNDLAFLYVVQPDSTVQTSNIKILASDGGVSAITGAESNAQVVTDGFDKLQNGTKISIKPAKPAPAPAGTAPAPAEAAPATAVPHSDVKKPG